MIGFMSTNRNTPVRSTAQAGISDSKCCGLAAASPRFVRLAILLLFLGLAGCPDRAASPDPVSAPGSALRVTIADKRFDLELALTPEQRHQGLSDRQSIADDGGMLFAFSEPDVLGFVMRRCKVPIDIIYLSPTGRIVQTHEMQVEPYDTPDYQLKTYSSVYPALIAIELKAGSIRALKLREGQAIELPIDDLKRRAK